ncbi:4'-phosphopantetheinyl transferase family protein [Pseudidiomarina aestuarii]|uniref:4'-phosphopantetheinyl transferase family protein n=1 Tax=Pseudidiomarina aestuarii TaxID=624146 RepID=UPI001473CBD9|nr:4'-phosphopantetheinyl transferase superfamily protein [Pseudidiomarina aestuarii]
MIKRKAEYLAARIVVKQALSALGLEVAQQQVSIAKDRSPVWPKDIIGSISHTQDFAVCCVTRAAEISLIGVDSELILSAPAARSLAAEIHNETELKLMTDAGFSEAVGTSIIFSAKESLYKALYPVVCCYFGFEQARVSQLDLQRSRLTLTLCRSFASQHGLASDYTIQFSIKGTLVHTLLLQS